MTAPRCTHGPTDYCECCGVVCSCHGDPNAQCAACRGLGYLPPAKPYGVAVAPVKHWAIEVFDEWLAEHAATVRDGDVCVEADRWGTYDARFYLWPNHARVIQVSFAYRISAEDTPQARQWLRDTLDWRVDYVPERVTPDPPTGWRCPNCGRGLSPWATGCPCYGEQTRGGEHWFRLAPNGKVWHYVAPGSRKPLDKLWAACSSRQDSGHLYPDPNARTRKGKPRRYVRQFERPDAASCCRKCLEAADRAVARGRES